MNVTQELRWSDIWFLTSLYICSLKGWDRLRKVIAVADTINHAVINFEEISSALVRLERYELIVVEANPWRARCTLKAVSIIEPIARQNSLAFRIWQEVEKAMVVSPWKPREALPNPKNSLRYPGFTKDDYDEEVVAYVRSMHQNDDG